MIMTVHLVGGVSSRDFAAILALSAAFGQELTDSKHTYKSQNAHPRELAEWLQKGRTALQGQSAAALRLRAHRQKLAWREQRAAQASSNLVPQTSGWSSLGPAPPVSDGNQFGFVSGRATAVAVDPSDPSGNTVYAGGAYGGVWKSTNAATAIPSDVVWIPVTDQQASLATGAISIKPDGSVVLRRIHGRCGGSLGNGGGNLIQPPVQIVVTVSPGRVDLYPNLPGAPIDRVTQPFTALVSDTGNENVTWSVVGGDANGTVDANGLYTAPAAVPNPSLVTVTATSKADTTKSGTAKINILTPTSSGTWPITVTVTEATQPIAQHTANFNLTVN